jgi:hypothetical protein
MRNFVLIAAILFACIAWTQGPDVPRLGWMRAPDGALRPIAGLAGNFLPGEARLAGVRSTASSGSWTLAKTDTELIVLGRDGEEKSRFAAPGTRALFAFSPAGDPAAVYLPEDDSLFRWSGGEFERASWRPGDDGAVLALACPAAGVISFAVQRGETIWQVARDGSDGRITLEWALPGAAAPLLLQAGGEVLYSDGGTLIRRRPDGSEQRAELPAEILALAPMGDGWVCAETRSGGFAIRLPGRDLAVFELPGGPR